MKETNPFLGEQIIEVVHNQMRANDPPETKQTYERLIQEGHSEENVMKMLASAVAAEIWYVMNEKKPFNHDRYVKMLDALPELPK
jgi:hypothetical protein